MLINWHKITFGSNRRFSIALSNIHFKEWGTITALIMNILNRAMRDNRSLLAAMTKSLVHIVKQILAMLRTLWFHCMTVIAGMRSRFIHGLH